METDPEKANIARLEKLLNRKKKKQKKEDGDDFSC
jgi:hypothetical protein